MEKRKNSATRKVEEYLKTYGHINRDIAEIEFNTLKLAQIINQLKNEGLDIVSKNKRTQSINKQGKRVLINEYYLRDKSILPNKSTQDYLTMLNLVKSCLIYEIVPKRKSKKAYNILLDYIETELKAFEGEEENE